MITSGGSGAAASSSKVLQPREGAAGIERLHLVHERGALGPGSGAPHRVAGPRLAEAARLDHGGLGVDVAG
ncbi:hypothetical protein [Micromonospora carbonacea]|uniref:Uncharacterized protein n=1 Tax=Micromonospora carbonacea TaxID=47853 RepID=A0A7H8XS52_9ACTN|nr:hypothetical protein [Micromonospora carbonacea]MBB5825313.1 hypothetical protein [Micromonospora carbonacea]QLD26611.1 hypothetical protein HXZ27_22350 [Micromonospora carbonacea]